MNNFIRVLEVATNRPLNLRPGTLCVLEMNRAGKNKWNCLRSVALQYKICWQFKPQKY